MPFKYTINNLRHYLKLIANGKDPLWDFQHFENKIHPQTWSKHDTILEWAEEKVAKSTESSIYDKILDPVVEAGLTLQHQCLCDFRDKLKNHKQLRILIHVPSIEDSPGGFSLFSNLLESIAFLGVPAVALEWNEPIQQKLTDFSPNVFITSDHPSYLNKIDWNQVAEFRKEHKLLLGLTASTCSEPVSLSDRFKWAHDQQVNFYYSFHSEEFLKDAPDYKPFTNKNRPLFSLEFGANILFYYPVPGIKRDIEYVFLASHNPDKWERYCQYLPYILERYAGFLDGPGWSHISRWAPKKTHRYIYARAKVGLNLHIPQSIATNDELNERTYILAACGVPQLIDNAKLLPSRFSDKCFFMASSPEEYEKQFAYIIKHPEEANEKALQAINEVYSKHTTFHRAENFIKNLSIHFNEKN